LEFDRLPDGVSSGLQVLHGVSGQTATERRSPDIDRGAVGGSALTTELLTVRFGGLAALSQINFSVQRDQIHAIIGPNGAGKSTFFNCLTGVLRPTSGRILFNGDDITGLPSNVISQKGIARSYQITSIMPNATVRENVRIAAQSRRHGWSMLKHYTAYHDIIDKSEAVLKSVGLYAKADELENPRSKEKPVPFEFPAF
jgi:branched-chain amino acid transport system ATP-binding protein